MKGKLEVMAWVNTGSMSFMFELNDVDVKAIIALSLYFYTYCIGHFLINVSTIIDDVYLLCREICI